MMENTVRGRDTQRKHTVEIKSLFPNEKKDLQRAFYKKEEEEYKQINRRNTVH